MRFLLTFVLSALAFSVAPAQERLSLLFLGDQGHHQPRARADQLIPVLAKSGIDVVYIDDMQQLNLANLKKYAGLIVFANIDLIEPDQEAALLEYVAGGGGFIPLHCASYCFRNSPAVVDLIGAQFLKHGGEEFSTVVVQPEHPVMQGFHSFQSWDETYIHTKHNERNRIVLEVRKQGGQADGKTEEPWTWVRTHGRGRVFYTAWGHDERTWGHAGFLNLVQRGIRWACGQDPSVVGDYSGSSQFVIPTMTAQRNDVAPFEFEEVGPKIPNYLAGERWGVQGDVISKMQKPLSPQESLKHFVTPENFHLELFVSEPEIQGKPIAMNWDHRGRLWICETIDYPNELLPPEQGRDRIRICEDSDGDGRADKFTVFAEQLSIPTSLEFCDGGILVQAGVETLFLRDNDGDDRADQREAVITGWVLGDTHGGVSNFQYGLDNRYWAMQGYNDSKPKFAGGAHQGFRQGPFNFTVGGSKQKPEVTQVEFVRSTTNNSWGLGISEEGLIFASTANRAPSFFVPIPNRYYERVRGWTPQLIADAIAPDHYFKPITNNVRQVDHHGGYTAGAGHALYTARNYPQSWWNRTAFVCGPTGHLIGTFILERKGATFRDRNAFNLVASDDEWSAPIMAEVGPDGNVWIIDWYNYIVQHNPTPQGFKTGKGNAYESDLRDKTHGRIYRLVYDGNEGQAGAEVAPKLDSQQPQALIAALQHPNRLWRRHAQRLLVERGQLDVQDALIRLIQDPLVDSVGNNPGAVHALWTLHGLAVLGSPSGPAFQAATVALSHPAAGVRRNAALVLPTAAESVAAIIGSGIASDVDLQVQLGALMALADMPANESAGKLLATMSQTKSTLQDTFIKDAIICAAASHAEHFLAALLDLQVTANAQSQSADVESREVIAVVAQHLARTGMNSAALEVLLSRMAASDAALRLPIVEGLAAGWSRAEGQKLSAAAEASLMSLLEKAEPMELGPLLMLGSAFRSEKLAIYAEQQSKSLFTRIGDGNLAARERIAAAQDLIRLAGNLDNSVAQLVRVLAPQTPPQVSSGIVRALSNATAANVGPVLISIWPASSPALRDDIVAVLMARPTTTNVMLDAIEKGTVAVSDLSLDQRQTLSSHPDTAIRRRASGLMRTAGGMASADRQKVVEEFASAAHALGDATLGKQLFVKNCANCHKHSGEGNEVGPDLTGMAVHPKEELLIHILDPNRSVEGNFRRYTLLTGDGQVLTGMLAAESLSSVELIDAEGKRKSISREDIEQITSSNKSLMPEGFEQQVKVADMTNLLEFLTSKGRFVPLPLASVATAVSTKGLFSDSDDGPDRMVFNDWGVKEFQSVPFHVVDPLGAKRANILLLNGPNGSLPPKMPKQVSLPCNMTIKSLHFLSGVSGWGFPFSSEKTVSMIVRIHYADGRAEDHPLLNAVHFADYIRRSDVPGSTFAFSLRGQQIRYFAIQPKRREQVLSIDLVKGEDRSAPIVMAVTAEQYE